MKTLLVKVQRICKDWSTFLESSLKLQQAMFFKPITDHTLRYHEDWDDDRGVWTGEDKQQCIFEHPLIHPRHSIVVGSCREYEGWKPHTERYAAGKIDCNFHPNIIYRTESSWRKQLATQPPVDEIIQVIDLPQDEEERVVLGGETGVTMSDIVQQIGTLDMGEIRGQRCWKQVMWQRGSTYYEIEKAKRAVVEPPWYTDKQWEEKTAREELEELAESTDSDESLSVLAAYGVTPGAEEESDESSSEEDSSSDDDNGVPPRIPPPPPPRAEQKTLKPRAIKAAADEEETEAEQHKEASTSEFDGFSDSD